MPDDELLAEQRAYYRARAPEYDEWWQRRGRYDRGEEQLQEWNDQGSVLELAGGTGYGSAQLA